MTTTSVSRGTWEPKRLLDDLERLALRTPTRAEFFDEAALRLKRTVAFNGACWHTLDPGSDLITEHRLQDLPDRFPILANNEYAVDDVNKFADLARVKRKAATMSEATAGHPERSPRFRDLLTPAGLGPELRSSFVVDGTAWGALILVRRAGAPEFEERDIGLLAAASPLFARAVRRGLIAEACDAAPDRAEAPGVVELDASGALIRASSSAEPLLAELSGSTAAAGLRLASIHAVASATRMAIAGGGLSPREREVTQLTLRGATAVQTAQRLEISPHTVNDHMKAIFEKTGARTRGELSATLFFGEHLPRIQDRVEIGDDASFIDAPRPRGLDPT